MINKKEISYEKFIYLINNKKIKKMVFSLENYSHYKYCSIQWIKQSIIEGVSIDRLLVRMTKDGTEDFSFFKGYSEDYKLFKIKGKGSYTLKQLWEKINIINLE